MNSDTGEIKQQTKEEWVELFNQNPSKKENWFKINKLPDDDCKACEGNGYIGFFPNSKVIPCPCVFERFTIWALAMIKQRDLPKAEKDHGLDSIHRRVKLGK